MRNKNTKLQTIALLSGLGLLFVYGAAFVTAPKPAEAEAVTTNSFSETSETSNSYPSDTISGISAPIPDNAVVTEIGYGSDDHDFYIGAAEGKFYRKADNSWGVQVLGGKTNSSGVERRGAFVRLNSDAAGNPSPDTYLTRWGWASSHTSGGHGGDDSNPVNVCVHVKYKLFDPNTHVIDDSQSYESGNCSANGYALDPSWIRGFIQADPGTFLVNIWQFQFGNDAKLRGAQGFFRKLQSQTLDAQYITDTVPRNVLPPSSSQQATITMKNTGNVTWTGDNYQRVAGNCDNFPVVDGNNPTPEGETCTETYNVSSSTFKLRRTDTDNRLNAPSELDFQITASRTIRATSEPIIVCTDNGTGGGGGGWDILPVSIQKQNLWDRLFSYLVPSAKALIAPPGGGGETCEQQGTQIVGEVISSDSFNVAPGQTATFPITFTTQSSSNGGPVNLQYKMVKKAATDPSPSDVLFGDTATMPVTVGNGPTLTCSAYASVNSGTVADFAVAASGATSPVSVTMSSNPSGPTMNNSPLTLNDANSYADVAHVATSGLSSGDYTLTFNGNNGSSCQSQLNILPAQQPTVDLYFDGSKTPATVRTGYSAGTLSWQSSSNVVNCDANPATPGTQWTGTDLGANSSKQVGALNNPSYTFTIRCRTNDNQTVDASVTVNTSDNPGGNNVTADLKCRGMKDPGPTDGPCYVASGSYGMLYWTITNADSCSIDQGFGPIVPPQTDNSGRTTANLTAPITKFTLTCTGPGYPASSPKIDSVDIHTDVAPDAPQIKSADNTTCGTVKLSWQVVSGNDPVSFNVYRGTDKNSLPGNQLGSVKFTNRSAIYTYTDSPNPLDVPYYYSVSAVSAGGSESAFAQSQVVPVTCRPSFGGSDKDMKSVVGRVSKDWTADMKPCSNESEVVALPNNALFGVNDKVTFQLNICNTGTEDLTNVSVNDTPINLSNLTYISSWDGNSACTDPNRFNYNSQTNSLTIHTDSVPKTDNSSNPKYCRVVYRATVTAPANPTTDIYRFQNKAVISADNLEPKTVTTPPYLFSLSGGVPNRNETAPSH